MFNIQAKLQAETVFFCLPEVNIASFNRSSEPEKIADDTQFNCNYMDTLIKNDTHAAVESAFNRAIRNYIDSRRKKIPDFVQTHFSFSGAVKINRKAFGKDLIKAPVNMAWALPYTAVQVTFALLTKVGLKKIDKLMQKIPAGLKTSVQEEINFLIFTQLLELPYGKDRGRDVTDALLAEILDQPEVKSLFQDQLAMIMSQSQKEGFKESLEKRLKEYSQSRNAVSEIAGNIIAVATGAGMMGKMTPGGISFGTVLAATIAQQSAISGFFMGPAIGSLYYGIFPASASMGLAVASTSTVLATLAIFSAFSGMITDPIQARLGIHEKRLNRLIDSLENTLMDKGDSDLKLRGKYLARVFDLLDLLKTAAHAIT